MTSRLCDDGWLRGEHGLGWVGRQERWHISITRKVSASAAWSGGLVKIDDKFDYTPFTKSTYLANWQRRCVQVSAVGQRWNPSPSVANTFSR